MSRNLSLKETEPNCDQKSVYSGNPGQNIEKEVMKSSKIGQG